jgi:hypothetical protein
MRRLNSIKHLFLIINLINQKITELELIKGFKIRWIQSIIFTENLMQIDGLFIIEWYIINLYLTIYND